MAGARKTITEATVLRKQMLAGYTLQCTTTYRASRGARASYALKAPRGGHTFRVHDLAVMTMIHRDMLRRGKQLDINRYELVLVQPEGVPA